MSNIEQIDFSTLTWVKTELDETLNRAKEALNNYVEDTEDINQLQFCVTYLHQIQGTLKMVELYGAAMVAEEMESVAKDLIEGTVSDVDSAYDVLMQSILQLPDYLERIELGHKDVPIVLLPLVNDLRAVRSQNLLSESALFNPNLDLGVPARIEENDVSLKGKQLRTALLKIRSVYQIALLNWIKNQDDSKGLLNIQLVISKLQMILSDTYLKQLFWSYSGLVEGLIEKHIDDNVSVKQIAGKVDHLIKELIDDSPQTKSSSRAITRNMLYYIAISDEGGRIGDEVKAFFELSQFIPDEGEVEHAVGSMSGKNKDLLQTVSAAINEDVLVVQESLDLFIRNKDAEVSELAPLLKNLQTISDTLGILGLGVARESVINQQEELAGLVDENNRPSDDQLLEVAKTLLLIESQLGDHIQSLGVTDDLVNSEENSIPQSEQKAILQTLAKESIVNLQQIKNNFVAFIESPWDKNQVKDNPKLLKEIAGAMKILSLSDAGQHLDEIIEYVNQDILGKKSKPSAMQLEQLATVISSIEYYLENLDQGKRTRENLISKVGEQLEILISQADNERQETNDEESAPIDDEPQLTAGSESDLNEEAVFELESSTDNNDVSETDEIITESQSVETDNDEQSGDSEILTELDTDQAAQAAQSDDLDIVVEFGDDVDEEIKEVFLEEFEEELANMQEAHEIWREDPSSNENKLTEIRRIFHTLKGSGRLVGAEAIGEFGWMLESACNRMIEGSINNSTDFKTLLAGGVDMAGGLFVALQDRSVAPNGYATLLQNADNVINNKPLLEEAVVETSESNDDIQSDTTPSDDLIDTDTQVGEELDIDDLDLDDLEVDELEPDDLRSDDLELDQSEKTGDELESVDSEAILDEEDRETASEDEADLEQDKPLDFIQYDIEELKEDQDSSVKDSDEKQLDDEESVSDDSELETEDNDLTLDYDLGEFDTLEDDDLTEGDSVAVSLTDGYSVSADSDNHSSDEISLNEDEILDLEADLAELDDLSIDFDDKKDSETEISEVEPDLSDEDLGEVELEGISLGFEDDLDEINSEVEAVEEESKDELDLAELNLDVTQPEEENKDSGEFDLELEATEEFSIDSDDEELLLSLAEDHDPEELTEKVEKQQESDEYDIDIDPVFVEILQKEVGGHLTEMSQFVSDSYASDDPTVNDDFVRVVHTLNGAASMASVDGITSMTAPLEKYSIMIMDRSRRLNKDDLTQIEALIKHAQSQLSLLGTGTVTLDESIGEYFNQRIEALNATEEHIRDAEDLAAAENLDVHSTGMNEDENEEISQIDNDEELNLDTSENDDELVDENLVQVSPQDKSEESTSENQLGSQDEEMAEEAIDQQELEPVFETTETENAPEPFQQYTDEQLANEAKEATQLELDEELLEIFSEEATEIFDRADHQLAELEEQPNSPAIIQALQRDLHTLKGGARMAGLNQIGDLSHQLESLFESIAESDQEVKPDQHEMMSQIMHKLHGMVNSDDYGLTASIDKETKHLEEMLSSEGAELKEKSKLDEEFFDPLAQRDDLEPTSEDTGDKAQQHAAKPKKKANVLSGGQIKVNSELLDKLVNFAGEVSIYRSRMEQQSAELKLNIDELENTVERVRRQLRELEHETEAQIISNYQLEGDDLEEDFDPLELDQFSTIQQLSRSLSESVSDLTNIQSYLQESARSSETLLVQQSRVNTELQEGLMETRLVTFNSLVPRLRRVLRTAGQELDKSAKLIVNGAEGEMDKTVLEGIQAPLEHMIRNSMVHGIESDRKKLKKPEQGKIEIELSREATEVVITVKDDGSGINTEVLQSKAIERGIIDKGDKLSEHDIAQLIIHSGLSAANEVSKLAGRGVGMDVVNNEIKRLGGSIEIITMAGEGTTFVIRLPYTLALTQAIIVQVADHRYAIPASGVQGLIRMNIDEFRRRILENDLNYDYAGEQYQIQELNKLLSVDSEALIEGNQVPLVMIKSGDQGVALRVDQTFGGREIVVKSVGTQVASVPGIFGATILGDGAVVLILDIIPMHRAYLQKLERMEADGVELTVDIEEDETITVMVVDDSITMRRAGERMLARNDFEVMTAKDGLDALNKLQEQKPDLMLLDIEMPRMDGFELATNMKASDKFKDIPIIMITSRTGQKHKDRAKGIGVERYLGKPYQEVDLLENIKDLLQLEDA